LEYEFGAANIVGQTDGKWLEISVFKIQFNFANSTANESRKDSQIQHGSSRYDLPKFK
jgi:hypothetical protein